MYFAAHSDRDRDVRISKGMKVHFVGIGGVGMSAAASLSLEQGIKVSGAI